MDKNILERLNAMGIQTNAIMGTGQTGAGEELVPAEVLQKEVFDAIPGYSTFLGELPGNHSKGGRMLDKVENVPIIGDIGFFNKGTEKTSGAFAVAAGTNALTTGEIQITQKKLEMTIDITDELKKFSAVEFETKIKEKVGKAAARTIEALIINGDPTATATGNINLDDDTPPATSYYLQAVTSVRKAALATAINADTLAIEDFMSVANLLGDYFANPDDCLWLFNRSTYNKALLLSDFADASKRGKDSTLSGNALMSLLGSDLFIARDMGKTEADGKISTTAGNNTKGQFGLIWKPAIQYGFGGELEMRIMDFGKDGYQLQAWFYFGFNIIDKKAGVTDQSVATAINVAV